MLTVRILRRGGQVALESFRWRCLQPAGSQHFLHGSAQTYRHEDKRSRVSGTAAAFVRAPVPSAKGAFRKPPTKKSSQCATGPYVPVKGTVMVVTKEYWEVQLVNGARGQLRRQHMIQRAGEGDQLTFYILGSSPLGVADISLTANGRKQPDMLTDLLTVALGENKNFLPVSPKSSPNDIKNVLGISKSQFRTALQPLIRERRIAVTDAGVTLLPSHTSSVADSEERLSPAAQAAVSRMRSAELQRTTHRIIEAEENYGLRVPAEDAAQLLPPSARHALIQAPTGASGSSVSRQASAAEVASALRRGMPSAQPGKRTIEQQRKQRKNMRSSAYTLDPSQRFVYETGAQVEEGPLHESDPPSLADGDDALTNAHFEPAEYLKLGELALRSRATAPVLSPGKVFAGGKYTLSPAQSWRLAKLEQKYDFEVLDTVIDEADLPAYLGQVASAPPPNGLSTATPAHPEPVLPQQAQHTVSAQQHTRSDKTAETHQDISGQSISDTVRQLQAEISSEPTAPTPPQQPAQGGGRKRLLRAPRQRLAQDAAKLKEHFDMQLGDAPLETKRGGGQPRRAAPRGSVPGVTGEDSDLEFFMQELGEEGMGGYADVFSDGEDGVTEALTYPTRVHLTRALARGEVDVTALSASSRSALERQLRSSRLPEHRAVLAGIRAMRAQLKASQDAEAKHEQKHPEQKST